MDHKYTEKRTMGNHNYNKQRVSKQDPREAQYKAWNSGKISFGQMDKQAQRYTERLLKGV